MKRRVPIIILFFLVFTSFSVLALEECKGTIVQEDAPCFIFLSFNATTTSCNTISVDFLNISTLIYTQTMDQYNSFTCNATFNISSLGTYTFNYNGVSFMDSGSITVEVGNLNFFNITVFLVFMGIILIFVIFMHIFRDSSGSSIVYGWIATSLALILGSMILSPNFQVVRGIIFFIDVDLYLASLVFIIGMYTAIVSINLKRVANPKIDEP